VLHAELIFAGKEARLKLLDPATQFIVNTPIEGFSGTLCRGNSRADLIQGSATIIFQNGCIEGIDACGDFSGVFDPQSSDVLRLSGNHVISLNGTSVLLPIYISGQGNEIQGASFFNHPIRLADLNTSVRISLVNQLNQSVLLNGGQVILGQDLQFAQAASLVGRGSVDGQFNILTLPEQKTELSTLFLKDLSILQLRECVEVSGTLTFSSSQGMSIIDGADNVLDITNGSLFVAPGNQLILKNVTLRGLGSGKIILGNDDSRLVLVGSLLELNSSFTFSYGSVEVRSESSRVVVGENSLGFVNKAVLVLNGVDFMFDALMASNFVGIVAGTQNIQSIAGARILAKVQDASGPALLYSNRSNILIQSEFLTVNRTMSFSLPGPQPISLDGKGFSLKFPQVKRPVISVADGQTVIFKNISFEGFYPEHISLGVGSRVLFDDDTYVMFGGDSVLTYPIKCIGNCTFGGSGSVVQMSSLGGFIVNNEKTVRLINMVLKGLGQSSGQLSFLGTQAMASFIDVDLYLDSSYSFSTGKIKFSNVSSKVVTGANILSFDNDAQLIVDGISVLYDTQSSPDVRNIRPSIADDNNYVSLNGGIVRSFSALYREGDIILDQNRNSLITSEVLGTSRRMIFRGNNSFESTIVLNGNGYVLQMPGKVSGVIVIPEGKRVLIENLVLRDFLPEHIELGLGASISFGEGVVLQLADDAFLSNTYEIVGNTVIDGRYKMLDIGAISTAGIRVSGGAVLRIVNTYLMSVSGTRLANLDAQSRIQFASSSIFMTGDVDFLQGHLDIFGDVTFTGANKKFNFKSSEGCIIRQNAQLYLDNSVSLVYDNPFSVGNGLVLEDVTSRLFLHSANLISNSSRLILRRGMVFIDGDSAFKTDLSNSNAKIIVDASADVKVQLGGVFDIDGDVEA